MAMFQEKIAELEQSFIQLPKAELEYARLKRKFSIDEKFYNLLLEKKAEYSISKEGFVSDYVILERATLDTTPISPNSRISYIISVVIALFASIALIIIRYLMHNDITSMAEIGRLANPGHWSAGYYPEIQEGNSGFTIVG